MATPYDFLGPFFEAKIRAEDGSVLTLNPNGKQPNLPIAESLEVITTQTEVKMSVSLKPHTREIGFALLGDPRIDENIEGAIQEYKDLGKYVRYGNILLVRFGYLSDSEHMSDWLPGFILKPDITIGTTISITIPAESPSVWLARRTYYPGYIGEASESGLHQPITPLDAVKKICRKQNYSGPYFTDTQSTSVPGELSAMETDKRMDLHQRAGMNHEDFLKWICREYGADVIFLPNETRDIVIKTLSVSEVPVAKFVYGSDVYGDNVFPILGDISAPNMAMFMSRRGSWGMHMINLLKEAVDEEYSHLEKRTFTVDDAVVANAESNDYDKNSQAKAGEGQTSGDIPNPPRADPNRAKDRAQNELMKDSGTMIEFDSVGIPLLARPKAVIQVEVGKTWLSGNYTIISSDHRIDSSGYKMHIRAKAYGIRAVLLADNLKKQVESKVEEKKDTTKNQKSPINKG